MKLPERQLYNPLVYGLQSYNCNSNIPFIQQQLEKPRSKVVTRQGKRGRSINTHLSN